MNFSQKFENYPSPVFAIDKNGFISYKNYLASITFPPVHKGAKAERYTSINYSSDALGKGDFCGNTYTYFTSSFMEENEEYRLIFLSLSTFGEDLMPFDVYEVYKSKINSVAENGESVKERRYVREVHKNLVKAEFFSVFRRLFEAKDKNKLKISDENCSLESTLLAISVAVKNYLDGVSVKFDIDSDTQSHLDVCESDFINIILNTLSFSIINSKGTIGVSLEKKDNRAKIKFDFESDADVISLADTSDENSALNSSLSLLVAIMLAKIYSIDYKIEKSEKGVYSVSYDMAVKSTNALTFRSKDTIDELIGKYMRIIFY